MESCLLCLNSIENKHSYTIGADTIEILAVIFENSVSTENIYIGIIISSSDEFLLVIFSELATNPGLCDLSRLF